MIIICQICKKNFKTSHKKRKYCSRKCYGNYKEGKPSWNKGLKGYHAGKKHWNWQGGKYKNVRGYVFIYKPDHPNANCRGYVKRANLVMEKHLGRYLIPPELVHHKKALDNDRIEHLQLFSNQSKHISKK